MLTPFQAYGYLGMLMALSRVCRFSQSFTLLLLSCHFVPFTLFSRKISSSYNDSSFSVTQTRSLYNYVTPKSGAGLHKILLRSVLGAPQSFFDETDSGVTLNRFSQDMTLIDGPLPNSLVLSFSCKPFTLISLRIN
jgi:hypothetical protein